MSDDELRRVRVQAYKIILRAQEDQEFRSALRQDAPGTLQAAGLSPEDKRLLQESPLGMQAVDPELRCQVTCGDTTCWITQCAETCDVSIMF